MTYPSRKLELGGEPQRALSTWSPDDLPTHARRVYDLLQEHGEMTLAELADELDKSEGAIRNSLDRLRIAGCLEDRPDPTDPRRLKYSLRGGENG